MIVWEHPAVLPQASVAVHVRVYTRFVGHDWGPLSVCPLYTTVAAPEHASVAVGSITGGSDSPQFKVTVAGQLSKVGAVTSGL